MDGPQPLLPQHEKTIFQPSKITIPQTQTHRRPWTSAAQSCKEPHDNVNDKIQLHYHKLSHPRNVMLQTKQADQQKTMD